MPRQMKTILCGTDFSESSYRALEYALRFAKNSEGTLVVLHAVHVPAGELFTDTQHTLNFQQIEDRVQEMLGDVHRDRLESYPKTELQVVIGDPAEQLLKAAKDRSVDMIVTATHGRSGITHLIMGSVAEKIIRHSPCPVLVIRSGVE